MLPVIKPTAEAALELEAGYVAMAADQEREREVKEWIEGLIADVGDEPLE